MKDEKVLVVPTGVLESRGILKAGFSYGANREMFRVLANDWLFLPRSQVEDDASYKQIIPYIVLYELGNAMGDKNPRYFFYTRGSGGGEERLHQKRSIGIGGHISTEDAAGNDGGYDVYRTGVIRELIEEVDIGVENVRTKVSDPVGLIYDPSTPVGSVHLGVLHMVLVNKNAVKPREEEIAFTGFASLEQLVAERDKFEWWSQILIDHWKGEDDGQG